MSHPKFARKQRRRRRAKKLQPLTPEAHAAAAAVAAKARERARNLRRQWAADDGMYRNAALLEYGRRATMRRRSHSTCAKEITVRMPPLDRVHLHPDS